MNLLLESRQANKDVSYQLLLDKLTPKQCLKVKGPVVDMDNRFNEIFPFFDLFNKKFVPGDRLIDIFSSCFSFYSTNRQSDKSIKTHIYNLNNISFQVFTDLKYALVVSNASVKNQVTISIAHIYVHNRPIIKTIHYAMNIMSTKAELFTIRCGIN